MPFELSEGIFVFIFYKKYNKMLFSEKERHISLKNAELLFIESFFEKEEADNLQKELTENVDWQQGEIMMFGKKVLEPRLTAWYGDEGKVYTYSGKTQVPLPWNAQLLSIKHRIEQLTTPSVYLTKTAENALIPKHFNSVLLNYYRNGTDSMGFHSDNEKELGLNPTIASVNFGESRRFIFRRKDDKNEKFELLLTHGSLLVMSGEMQHHWQHAIPKEPKKTKPRINLTFRWIL